MELTVTGLAFGGEGVARQDSGPEAGRVVFVSGAAPGDRVRVEIIETHKRFVRARLIEVLVPGEQRVDPTCPIASTCGGCDWQHVAPDEQRRSKNQFVARALHDIGRALPVEIPEAPPIRAEEMQGYRHRVRLHFDVSEEGVQLGFRARGGHELVSVSHCPVAVGAINDLLSPLVAALGAHVRPGTTGTAVLTCGTDGAVVGSVRGGRGSAPGLAESLVDAGWVGAVVHVGETRAEAGQTFVPWSLDGGGGAATVEIAATGFSQTSPAVTERILGDLRSLWTGPDGGRVHLLELFAGAGTWTLGLAPLVERITALELQPEAVEALLRGAKSQGLANVSAQAVDLGQPASLAPFFNDRPDSVLLDPPREGAADLMGVLVRLAPSRIVYLSCDPTTQARDVRMLAIAGYRLESVRAYDMFPHTSHVETLMVLSRD